MSSSQIPNNPPIVAMTGLGETARTQDPEGTRAEEETDGNRTLPRTKLPRGMTLSTYNVRTLYQAGKFDQLIRQASGLDDIDIIGIQEHRWITAENISKQWSDNKEFLFYYSTASPERWGGVGILVRRKYAAAIRSVEKVSNRILKISFEGNPMLTIFVAHAPHEDSPQESKDEFYEDLTDAVKNVPPHPIVAVLGDFNARIGRSSHQQYPQVIGQHLYHHATNNNGNRLVNFCVSTQFREVQSRFPQPSKRLWTWKSPYDTLAQLDHILIRAKWTRSITNCRAYNSLEIDSDHRVVSARLRIRFRSKQIKKTERPRYNWEQLVDNEEKRREFSLKITNKFEALQLETRTTQDHYDAITSNVVKTAESVLGERKKQKKKAWVSDNTLTLLSRRNSAKRKYQHGKTPALRKKWRDLAKAVQLSYEEDDMRYLQRQVDELKKADRSNNPRKTWRIINEISGKTHLNPASQVKAPDGRIIETTEELMSEWRDYFHSLLNAPPVTSATPISVADEDLPIPTGDFTDEEMLKAIDTLNKYKPPGIDYEITAEAIQYGGSALREHLLYLFNRVHNEHIPPSQWITNMVNPLPKKGDKFKMTNYRGITLMSITAKLYNRLLLNRIREPVEAMLLNNQAGFRPGRSCTEHIHVLRRMVEGCRYQKLPVVMTFVDFRKAFDSIDRKQMLKILRHYGIPEQIVKSIEVLYCDTNSTVIVDGVLSDLFEVMTGVLQGDVLAPFIFIIIIDWVLRQSDLDSLGFTMVPRRSRRYPEEKLSNLGFADDITLLANSVKDAQSQLNKIAQAAAEVGLNINIGKTKVLALNLPAPKITLNDVELEVVNDFEYLGSYIASTDHDIQCRKGKAWGAFWKLKRVWQSTAPMALKMDISKSSVLSILQGPYHRIFN